MRLKFKPNVSSPRGTSASVSSEAGGGVRGGGGEAKRKHQRQRSRGDESAGTGGESSSDLETSESNVRRRQRRTSERSGSGHQSSLTAEKSSSQSNKESDPKRTETTTSTSGSVSEETSTVGHTQSDQTSLLSSSEIVSESNDGSHDKTKTSSNEKLTREIQTTTSPAGQVQSSADSALQSLSTPLTRGDSAAPVAGGRTTPRIKKKVAPKVVSSRPRRATLSKAVTGVCVSEGNQTTPRPEEVVSDAVRKDKERDSTVHSSAQGEGDHSSSHGQQINSEEGASNRSPSLLSANVLTNQTSDEAISNTLNEVLHNTHSQELEDIGLAGIVPSRLGLLGGLTPSEDLHCDSLHGDSIITTAQRTGHTEVEVRTESADVSKTVDGSGSLKRNEKTTAPSVNSDLLNSEESFVYQTCTDGPNKTSQSPQSTVKTSQSTSPSPQSTGKTSQSTSPSPQSTGKNGQSTSPSLRSTGKTSQSTSPSSSQESSQRSRRSGSASERSQRSQSRASSVGSEASGEGGKEPRQSGSKGKKRQRQKKTPTDTNEADSQGTPPPSKRTRVSVVKVRDAPDRSTMTMQELIYYNPTANPMSSSVEDKKKKKEEGQSGNGQDSRASSVQPSTPAESRGASPVTQDTREEERADQDKEEGGGDGRIVPTLRIGLDGKIIVDENSMVMETTQQDNLEDMGEVIVDSTGHTTSASYRQRCRVTRWTKEETSRFFKALSQVGTDFTMMTLLIPKRSRKELKNKFKKEERSNPHLVSQALSRT